MFLLTSTRTVRTEVRTVTSEPNFLGWTVHQIFLGMELHARACVRRRYKLLLFSLKLQNAAQRPFVFFEFICFYPNIKQKHLANFILNVSDFFPMHYTSLIST